MAKQNLAYKIELDPTNKQETMLRKCAGISRFAYNWGLADRIDRYQNNTGKARYTTAIQQNKEITRLKNEELDWLKEVSKTIPQDALRDLDQAFRDFFKGIHGFPKFKKKNKSKDSFRLSSTIRIYAQGKHKRCRRKAKNHRCSRSCYQNYSTPRIQLPRLKTIRIKEVPKFRPSTEITSATVSRVGDRWFVSLTATAEVDELDSQEGMVGLDMGLLELVIASDGKKYANPKPLKRRLRKLRKLNKQLARQQKRSRNWYKTVDKIRRLHRRIAHIRAATLHELTTEIVRNYEFIVIEDLNIKAMMKNRKLALAISDVGWGELKRQLEYKCQWYGSELIKVPRFFPSSKMCSVCYNIKEELDLSERTYKCEVCRMEMDRDKNAARNLKLYGELYLQDPGVADSWEETINACGEHVRPLDGFHPQIYPGLDWKYQMMGAMSVKHEESIMDYGWVQAPSI